MRPQPKEILNFMLRNFDVLKILFDVSLKQSYIMEPSLFNKIILENNADEKELLKFGVIKLQTNGYYKLDKHYSDFFEFLFRKSSLELPEKFNGYIQNIRNLFVKIRSYTNEPDEILETVISSLIEEIDNFLLDIEQQTNQLLTETESLKHNPDNVLGLTERLKTATLWVDNLIIPLNTSLNPRNENSIINFLHDISRYSNEKRLFEKRIDVSQWFERLYSQCQSAENEIKISSSRIVKELMPLLERIRESSKILSGFYYFLENEENRVPQNTPYPPLVSRVRRFAYSPDFFVKAEMLLDTYMEEQKAQQFEHENSEEEFWVPDTVSFRESLFGSLPIENFYEWCFSLLKQETSSINCYKFFTVAKLILDEKLDVELKDGRFDIELEDAIMNVPIIKAYERIS